MTWLITLIIGFGIGYLVGRRAAGGGGLAAVNEMRRKARQEALTKVRELFGRQTEATNDDVQKLLSVSDATATEYLATLEREGFVVQIGTEGRFVKYRRNG